MADSYVTTSAMLQCTFGMAPSQLTVTPEKRVMLANKPMANIMDFKPLVNIAPFGMCTSLANPTVASATAAAMGVLTPMPCIPNVVAPWMPGKPDYLIANQPALLKSCKCQCIWGGSISLTTDGQLGAMNTGLMLSPLTNQPLPRVKFLDPKRIEHDWLPINSQRKTISSKSSEQEAPNPKETRQQVPESQDKRDPDELVLLDAYWEKDGMQIRFIPHQMKVSLIVVFQFSFNDDQHDKSKAVFELTFDSPNTIFSQKNPIIIKGTDVSPLFDRFNKIVKDNDQPCYYYRIDEFSPDLSDISF